MQKKVDYGTFLEFFSHRILEIGIPVIVTLIWDACLTRFLEKTYHSAAFDRSFSQTISSESEEVSWKWAIIIAVILIGMIIIATALILVCYYYGCVKVIMVWMIIAVSLLLSLYLFIAFGNVPKIINTPFDWIALILFVINIAVIGDLSIFWRAPPIFTHTFLIIISVLIAVVFLSLPDWTVWVLLGVLIIYDCCVVLCPHGLLNVIIKKSEERGDSIPALVYSSAAWISKSHSYCNELESNETDGEEGVENESEIDSDDDGNGNNHGGENNDNASPSVNNSVNNVSDQNINNSNNNISNTNPNNNNSADDNLDLHLNDTENPESNPKSLASTFKRDNSWSNQKNDESNQPLLAPNEPGENDSDGTFSTVQTRSIDNENEVEVSKKKRNKNASNDEVGSENANKLLTEEERKEKKRKRFESDDEEEGIKLGLGDFVFYGILITRAARIGWDVTILCILAVILGLSLTLILLAIFQRPLPALPFSLFLGIIFYFIGIYTFRPFHRSITQLKITF